MHHQVGAEDLFQLLVAVIHLDEFLARQQMLVPDIAGSFIEARPQHQHQVGFLFQVAHGVTARGDAEAAQRQRGAFVDRAFSLEAAGHRNIETLADTA